MLLLITPPYLKLKFFLFPSLPFQDENNKYLKLLDYIRLLILKILLFLENNFKKTKKPFSKGQRAEIVRLPLVDGFRTFCWGEIMDELRNIYKLKELIRLPISTINHI